MASHANCASNAWLRILGIDEFFDERILGQVSVLTPWICVAASAAAASAARAAAVTAGEACRDGAERTAGELADTAFGLAVSLQRLRWSGGKIGEGMLCTAELVGLGR